ncbi:MAG TPA: hypothetical protein PK718_03085 [Candidatus Methanofastidiosa archaeon]|nr:hypothetical protein [Candidatus Methanofastidiosa archaeon]HPR41514.1 hypothetical protein [Candidatus Methanofastidiosa archaeon]
MGLRKSMDKWQKREEKREQRKAKKEGREPDQTVPPMMLAIFVVIGSLLTLMQPLNILIILFPLATRKNLIWDFKICFKIASMISVVYLITVLVFWVGEADILTSAIIGFLYNLATSTLILYVGAFLVRYLSSKG